MIIEEEQTQEQTTEKIQKFLANRGFGSRREIEGWIKEGRVSIDDKIATIGDRICGSERIKVNGKPIDKRSIEKDKTKIVIYHKPVGEITSRNDPEGRPTVFRNLPKLRGGRWISIGRLDYNTSGLLVFTNDGELANKLMHPSGMLDREYAVRVLGEVENSVLATLREGVELDDGVAKFCDIVESGGDGANHWYHVVLKEGRNREVRRLWESQGITVSRLVRVRFGTIILPRDLRVGCSKFMTDREVIEIKTSMGMEVDDVLESMEKKGRRLKKKRFSAYQNSGVSPSKKTPTARNIYKKR